MQFKNKVSILKEDISLPFFISNKKTFNSYKCISKCDEISIFIFIDRYLDEFNFFISKYPNYDFFFIDSSYAYIFKDILKKSYFFDVEKIKFKLYNQEKFLSFFYSRNNLFLNIYEDFSLKNL